jgi:hypothetical protein
MANDLNAELLRMLSAMKGGGTSASPAEGLQLLRAFFRLTDSKDRLAAIQYLERVANEKDAN